MLRSLQLQKEFGKESNSLILVLPYVQKDMEYYAKYYDDIILPDCVSGTHPKGAITKRNKWMIENSDLILCYVERDCGGAYEAVKYAKKKEKNIINIATDII